MIVRERVCAKVVAGRANKQITAKVVSLFIWTPPGRHSQHHAGTIQIYSAITRPLTPAALTAIMRQRTLKVERLGRVEYGAALRIQKQTERAVLTGQQPDTLLLLEHPHTLTLGRRAAQDGIIAPDEVLRKRGVTVFETNRGGKITYHGLGQIVGYPIINLSPDREDVHRFVRDLEEVLIRTMRDFEIEAFRIQGLTGAHTSPGKVAAIGVHIARWVTTHGFALNVNTDLSYFDLIIACEGEPVTSMKELLGREVEMGKVEDRIIERFAEVFEMEIGHRDTETQRPETVTA